ncbi:hypothetical protein B0I37DRAFT_418277 [Chaetomium sp. MPI-CAGE-AT-0009]|nr:hypothetical protein B0I37DRAFT_418277 [Chaetomium sp. MPI-CAGE-AT-0009]
MSGPSGFIKSSDHPLLGRLLHFTAFSADLPSTLLKGDINKSWLRRMEGIASVANQAFDKPKRHYYEVLGMRWRTHSAQLPYKPATDSENEGPEEEEKILLPFIDLKGAEHKIPADKCESWDALLQTLKNENVAKPPFIIRGMDNKAVAPKSWRTLHRVICKGDLKPTFKIAQGEYVLPRPEGPVALKPTLSEVPLREANEAALGSPPCAGMSGTQQKTLSSPFNLDLNLDLNPGPLPCRRIIPASLPLILVTAESIAKLPPPPLMTSSTTAITDPPDTPPVLPFFWAPQIYIELGPWATPWAQGLYTSCLHALPMMVDVALIGLSYTLHSMPHKPPRSTLLKTELIYTTFPDQGPSRLDDLWQRLRGGVTGLEPTTLTTFAAFGEGVPLPPLALLKSVHDAAHSPRADKAATAGAPAQQQQQQLARDRLVELASLDLWLSCAARTAAELWLDFGTDIMRTREERWSPRDGGDYAVRQLAKRMAGRIARVLFPGSTPAEQYFVWVAFLRAVKVMLCVQDGSSTYDALGVFKNDILVYLV